ncbi:NAD(P)-dependent dehydrogenase, short-chain alcohol dehydrogenase family [Noviherbaspirillum humi]|uniref:NAD(P)-dependent dehydrogenase, short-chain alcohol dehydrogenase family n=1 Tax=Noviherbaspirillum humi TaxID=1688639 RepID=A0A239EWL4_9BURK|nr:SDR family oxidoreductase [Noviherbaspirillum humi]SNS49150.1 NAD(P)-dependent dehydrogenase, short-chain alcohol dehydrogenase family [Noviherbaspirillum humi]
MKLQDATILVTGANRGLGLAFVHAALERGARKVYAAARDPRQVTTPGVTPLRLDVLDEAGIAAAARQCDDVTLVINNAGIASVAGILGEAGPDALRRHMDTNFFGMLHVSRQFAPILKANGGGALLNVLSVASFANSVPLSAYSVSKAAAWGLTNALRNELAGQGTQVLALHVGFIDTDLTRDFDVPKTAPAIVAARAFDALESGASEVMADDVARRVKQGLALDTAPYLQALGA